MVDEEFKEEAPAIMTRPNIIRGSSTLLGSLVFFRESSIIKKELDEQWLISKIKPNQLKVKSLQMLFSSARDGWRLQAWRQKCIQKGPTLTIIKSKANKVCGGYLHISWEADGGLRADPLAFVFSLDNKRIFLPNFPDCAAYFGADNGPNFGVNTLTISDAFLMN